MIVKKIKGVRVLEKGSGIHLVLLHPAGQPPEGFIRQINLLSPHALIVSPNIFDLAREASQMNFEQMAAKLKLVMDSYPGDKKIFIGCSLGGGLALAYAAKFPKEVKRLIVCDTTGIPLNRSLLEWIKAYIQMTRDSAKLPKEIRRNNPGYYRMINEILINPIGVYKAWKISAKGDLTHVLGSVLIPTKILWGSADRFIPVDIGERIAKLLPNANLEIVDNPSHFWYHLEPNKFVNFILKAIK